MSATYRTSDGDMIDAICWKYYGRTQGAVEAVLAANPKLSDYGPVLDAGILIVLPDLPAADSVEVVKLWS